MKSFDPIKWLAQCYYEFATSSGDDIRIDANSDFYNCYAGNIQTLTRFSDKEPTRSPVYLIFKSSRLYNTGNPGWTVKFSKATLTRVKNEEYEREL